MLQEKKKQNKINLKSNQHNTRALKICFNIFHIHQTRINSSLVKDLFLATRCPFKSKLRVCMLAFLKRPLTCCICCCSCILWGDVTIRGQLCCTRNMPGPGACWVVRTWFSRRCCKASSCSLTVRLHAVNMWASGSSNLMTDKQKHTESEESELCFKMCTRSTNNYCKANMTSWWDIYWIVLK